MRLSGALLLGVLATVQAGNIGVRQDSPSTVPVASSSSADGGGGGSSSSSPPQSSDTGGDQTVTVTTTVDGAGSTEHRTTTIEVTSVKTITVTSVFYGTTIVTSHDQDTSTKTVLFTTTKIVNAKRHVHAVDDVVDNVPAAVPAAPTVTGAQGGYNHLTARALDKRATVTSTVTVTGGGSATTVVDTVTKAVGSTTSTVVPVTSFVTETFQANAKTTTTVTSTVTETSTAVSTGLVTSTPTGDSSGSNNNNNSGGGGGLSTGAKAGIGAGVGVAGLLAIGALIFCCMRRRRGGSQPDRDDLMAPSSMVPVGGVGAGAASRNSRPMSEQRLGDVPGAAPRREPILPKVTPEGYRGTAMGDGRAGYAKPDPYGAAYATSRSNTTTTGHTRNSTLTAAAAGDQLPRHPTPETGMASVSPMSPPRPETAELGNDSSASKWHTHDAAEMATDSATAGKWHSDNAAEIDGQPAMGHKSGPVYEMP